MINFQAMSKISGDAYQEVVRLDLESRGFMYLDTDVEIENTGCEVDFVADRIEYVECKGGYNGEHKRPGEFIPAKFSDPSFS